MSRTPFALVLLAAIGCQPDPREITDVSAAMQPIVDGSNAYAWSSWQASRPYLEGNMFYSSFSQVAAMSMVYAGAEGETEAQIGAALGVPEGGEAAWHENLGALIADLAGEHHRAYTLYTADQLWGQEGYPWETAYLDLMDDAYQAPLEDMDFAADPEGAREDINRWVADQTHDRIPELFEPGDIVSETRLVLANAIYFLADWRSAFDPADTSDDDFTLADGGTVRVPMMRQEEDFSFAHYEGASVLELPYEGGEVSMVFLLPDDPEGLEALEDQLSAEQVAAWIAGLADGEVLVRLPSFQLDCTFPIEGVLRDLGVEDVFDPDLADLSGQLDPSVDRLWVGRVVHKAFVRLDEEGTEAAAATGVAEFGSAAPPEEERTFIANHPFIFLIRDRLTGTILFQGRMADPSQAPLGD